MAQTTKSAKPEDILPVSITPQLRLSKTEYAALETIAKASDCTIEKEIATIVHRAIHTELEETAPRSPLKEKIMAEYNAVWDAAEAIGPSQIDAEKIEVTVTIPVNKAKYEQLRRLLDDQSWIEFVDYCVNSGHMDEVLGDNPDLMAEFVKAQNERLYGKKQEA